MGEVKLKYLMCLIPGQGYTYHDITPQQEKRINDLLSTKKMPKTFTLGRGAFPKEIDRDTIIGFTNDKPDRSLGIKNIDDLRTYVKQQEWYKKYGKKREKNPEVTI